MPSTTTLRMLYRPSAQALRPFTTEHTKSSNSLSSSTTTPMAPTKVAINGCGRIGRLAFRIAWAQPEVFEIVACNDITAAESVAYLIKYDSVHGTFGPSVEVEGGALVVKDGSRVARIAYSASNTVQGFPLAGHGVDLVLECTGVFLTHDKLQPYFDQHGVKKVVVSAPVKDTPPVLNVVMGCNETIVDAPNAKKADLRRARSGLVNLAPTSTGSATAIALIFPDLKGKLNGLAVRVPLTNASITDCVFEVKRGTTVEEVNSLLQEASKTYLAGILGFDTVPKVSTDYVNDPRSSIVDAECTQVIDGTMVKIYAWYDNEYGYSCRLVDLAKHVAAKL